MIDMIFPNLALWNSRDPNDAAGRIDRALNDRNHRLSAGLSITDRFSKVLGALVLCQGNGKYLRVRHVVFEETEIPKPIRNSLIELEASEGLDLIQTSQVLSDLAEIQAMNVERLKCEAGKYVDRVLAVSVTDPGFWGSDFDGRSSYSSICDPTRLAEQCGVSVIDSFPARDLAVGGTGKMLEALPSWLLFADREEPVANQTRALLSVGESSTSFVLPPSDGLDAEVPLIQAFQNVGFRFLDQLTRQFYPPGQQLEEMDLLYANGLDLPALRGRWDSIVDDAQESLERSGVLSIAAGHNNHPIAFLKDEITQALVDAAKEILQTGTEGKAPAFSNVIRTGVQWVSERVLGQLDSSRLESKSQIMIACSAQYEACLVNQLSRSEHEVVPVRQLGFHQDELSAVIAALLGIFHIDQLPANIPWLTGAESQRILGRLTPGRPSSWRNLIRTMSDFHPAPMKLRDAV